MFGMLHTFCPCLFLPPQLNSTEQKNFCFDIYALVRIKWWNYAASVSHIFRLNVFDIRGVKRGNISVTVGSNKNVSTRTRICYYLVKIYRVGRCFNRKNKWHIASIPDVRCCVEGLLKVKNFLVKRAHAIALNQWSTAQRFG